MSTISYGRLIDRLEAAADSAAIRDRAFALIARRKAEERAAVKRWLMHRPPTGLGTVILEPKVIRPAPEPLPPMEQTVATSKRPGPKAIQYDGKTLHQWADDLGLTYGSLLSRISRMGSVEAALAAGQSAPNKKTRAKEHGPVQP